MKKKVWIMNHYASHMLFDKGGRHYNFAKYLYRNGYSPVVFCANMMTSDLTKKYFDNRKLLNVKIADEINTPFLFVRVRPYSGNGIGRIENMMDFYFNVKKVAKKYAKRNGKPDIILASSVHPLTMVAGIQLAKYFGIRCICEVRDLWPEAIVTYSRKIKRNSLIAKAMYSGEKWIYKKADAVIFTQEGGPDYVREHKWDDGHGGPIKNCKLFHINNGVDLENFDRNVVEYPYEDNVIYIDDIDGTKCRLFKTSNIGIYHYCTDGVPCYYL